MHTFFPFVLFFFFLSADECAAQDYVEICDCTKGVKGVCKEYLDSNWQIVQKEDAIWYYYNYSFGRYRFFDWSWNRRFVNRNQLVISDTSDLIVGQPAPLSGHFYWHRKNSNEISVEQSFTNGWPSGQTKAFSKKGYLLECLDFDSPYNRGKFSMMCHLYHKGKLDLQCVFAVDMADNKSYAVDVPWKVNEPPTTLSVVPLFQRSLVLDIQGLQNKYISAENTPSLFHLIAESCYASAAQPLCYENKDVASIGSCNFLYLYEEARGWRVNQIYADRTMVDEIENSNTSADVFYDDSEFELMKMCRSSLRENEVRHLLVALDTLQIAIDTYGDTTEQFMHALHFADRCVNQLMQYMRMNSRELDWNCVLITSSSNSEAGVPWILWGEDVRSNYVIEHSITPRESFSTFATFARLQIVESMQPFLLKDCHRLEYKRN